jgi:hypothetical protein
LKWLPFACEVAPATGADVECCGPSRIGVEVAQDQVAIPNYAWLPIPEIDEYSFYLRCTTLLIHCLEARGPVNADDRHNVSVTALNSAPRDARSATTALDRIAAQRVVAIVATATNKRPKPLMYRQALAAFTRVIGDLIIIA